MRLGDAKRGLIAFQIAHAQTEERNNLIITAVVNGAKRIEFVYAWCVFARFDVRYPGVGNIIFFVMPVPRDLFAFLLHFAGGQSKAFTQCLHALSGSRTWLARVHWRESYPC